MKHMHCRILNPFRIDIDPMQRLLLINFEKDPDSVYIGFEPQVFDDEINGKGHIVIGWRKDGKVDVYHQDSVALNPRKYDIAGKGLATMAVTQFSQALYEVAANGVLAQYAFTDIYGRDVVLKIEEGNTRIRKPFGLLAPMGDAAEAPSALPLILLHDFYFVRKQFTHWEVRIAGRAHRPDELPIPIDFARMFFTRYSPKPLIATFNPAMDGPLPTLEWDGASGSVEWEGHLIFPVFVQDIPAIQEIVRHNAVFPLRLAFQPPFPHIESLASGAHFEGGFRIEAHPCAGSIAGKYEIIKQEHTAQITLCPSRGWRPNPSKLSLWFLYTVAAVFRNWPKSYIWEATLTLHPPGTAYMQAAWRRIQSIRKT